ncbi:regulatory protein RecX [bacterium]|nr:MAG: regulatory protein RecX [bacterium]
MARSRDLSSGRNYVSRLIKFRIRSEKELRDKLKAKQYDGPAIDELIAYFKRLGYVNDKEFARGWINYRLSKPLALRAIEAELRQKGIGREIINELIGEKKSSLNEFDIARELVKRRLEKLKGKKDKDDKIKQKLYYYLARRGFSNDIVSEAINQI